MAAKKILVPYNFTVNDEKSLDFVIQRFGAEADAEVTLFNAYTPAPEIDVKSDPVMQKMNENLAYLQSQIYDHETKLGEASQRLVRKGFSADKIHCVFTPQKKSMGQEIVDLARELKADVIVLNRSPAKITRFFTRSNSEKVIQKYHEGAVFVVN